MTGTSAFNSLEVINNSATTTFTASASTTGNFFASTNNVHLAFAPASTLSVDGAFVVHGTSGNLVNLFSSTPNSTWNIAARGTTAVTYARVQDSSACGYSIDASTGGTNVDAGLNSCWLFTAAPLLSAATNQSFTFGDASTPMAQLTVTDFTTPTITAANDLRIPIATSTTFMLWDVTDTTATLGGTALSKVCGGLSNCTSITYEGGGSVMVVPVDTNFAASDTLTISDLSVKDFTAASAPLPGFKIFKDGSTDQVFDANNSRTVAIKGTLAGAEHAAAQVTNAIDSSGNSFANALLYGFNLALEGGEQMSVTSLPLSVSAAQGISSGDITNAALFVDYNGDKVIDAGDLQVVGDGSASISGETGAITFSSAFMATTTRDYLLRADVNEVEFGDSMTLALTPNTVVASGLISLLITTPASSVALTTAQHVKIPRGGSEAGGGAPSGQGIRSGGSAGGGALIGSDPNFFPPTTSGGTFNEWSAPSDAFASDEAWATAGTSWFREDYGGFGFNVPPTNTINGIEVKLELSGTTAAGTISVALSWDGGTSTTTVVKTSPTLTTADAVITLGGPSDTWDRTWSSAELSDANFKVRLVAEPSSNTVRVDAIQVNVHDIAGGGAPGGGGEVLGPSARHFANAYQVLQSLGGRAGNTTDQSFLTRLIEKLPLVFFFF